MGSTADGDLPAGSIGFESIFACGLTLFVSDPDHEHDRDPLRAEVQAGVRTTAPPPPADAAVVRMPGTGFVRDRSTQVKEVAFAGLLLFMALRC